MLNIDKIKLMNKIAKLEKDTARERELYNDYFKNDYLVRFLILKFFKYNLGVIVASAFFFFCNLELIISSFYLKTIYDPIKLYIIFYILGLVLYMSKVSKVYEKHYNEAQKNAEEYNLLMDKLNKRYTLYKRIKELNSEES